MEITRGQRNIITVAIVAAVLLVSGMYIYDRNGGTLDFSETDVKIVVSGSMDGQPRGQYDIKTIPVGSMVFIHKVSEGDSQVFYSSLEVGDVITFHYRHPVSYEDMVVTHRITSITESGGVYTYECRGDSIVDDPTNGSVQVVTSSSGDVIGKVVGVAPWLGQLVVFLSTWEGKVCLIITPCLILILSEMRNIIRILHGNDGGSEDIKDSSPVGLEFSSTVPPQERSDDVFVRRP